MMASQAAEQRGMETSPAGHRGSSQSQDNQVAWFGDALWAGQVRHQPQLEQLEGQQQPVAALG